MFFFALLFVGLVSVATSANSSHLPRFGSCPDEKNTCKDCYFALKLSLLSRDENIKNLSRTFFPPRANKPEFVTVTYRFDNTTVPPKVWFWTHDSSYLFFPLKTFQYLSLFFGKIETQVSRNVTLTLDEECSDTDHGNMELLTQRVRN